jgi:hypothetical protein
MFKMYDLSLEKQKYVCEEMESTLKSRNACYISVQNLLSSLLIPQNVQNFNFVC